MTQSFYQTEDYLRARLEANPRRLGFRAETQEEWRIWRSELRGLLHELSGLDRLVSTSPNPRITEVVGQDGFRRERVEIDTEPGVIMPLYVLVPDDLREPQPAVIAAHGHGSGGKLCPAGCREVPGVDERIQLHNYDYGLQAVRQGYVVFCPDARGFGERRERYQEGDEFLFESSCRHLAHMGLPLGLTVAGMWAWDLICLLDYIATRPETRGQPAGCIGLSGGGLQTLWLTALDDRVDCAVISGYFYGVGDALLHLSDNCDCNYVPHLWENVDMGDLAALIAPRPLLIEAGTRDPLNGPRGIDNVVEQFDIARGAYALLGAADRVALDAFEGEHVWHGVQAWPWLDRWLRRSGADDRG